MTSSKSSKRSKDVTDGRTRSFGGCATCRLRHIKCDEGKPACSTCQHSGITCAGYEKNIFFAAHEDDAIERFRRPLFTVYEREQMSMLLASSLPSKHKLLQVLSQLDEECERPEFGTSDEVAIQRGPFGAFKLAPCPPIDDSALSEVGQPSKVPADAGGDCPSSPAFIFTPRTQEIFESFIQNCEQIIELPSLSATVDEFGYSRIEELFDESTSSSRSGNDRVSLLRSAHQAQQLPEFVVEPTSISNGSPEPVPCTAVELLKHYSTTVIGLLTPSRHTKTLWHVLFLPHVKSSLAAMSMSEALDHASLCSFYGTLSISAFHLKAVSGSQHWYTEGRLYKEKARDHVSDALRTAYDIPKVAKYKSILMAILTMVQVSMFDGDWKQTECYLLEAEKFIRLRGLHKTKSRKRRLLHHCYAFMRLLHESLFLMTTHSLQRMHVRLAVESSGLLIAGQDSPSFRLSAWNNLVKQMLEVKSPDEGENDLHLERPGFFSSTMYPEIYGLPEEWLVMLSQVIRLGNEKQPLEDGTSWLSLKEFSIRAKDLEQCIVNWQRPSAELFCSRQHVSNIDERVLNPLLDALHQALIIYFYRRIYDIHPSMLQKRVEDTCASLVKSDQADSGRVRYTSVFIWPAFIAACEAESNGLQSIFNRWFEDCTRQSGQSSFKHMHTIMKQVWAERHSNSASSVTWLDFMKNSNVIQ